MSACGNCDCADKSQCVKKGNCYSIDMIKTENRYYDDGSMGVSVAEHDPKCKCGPNCTCTSCGCGH